VGWKEIVAVNFPEWPNIISVSVVPVVIISACGLLCLAFYGRLAALVAHLRTFQREMLRGQERWAKAGLEDHQLLLEVLRKQTLRVAERARLIRLVLFPPFCCLSCAAWRCCSAGFSTRQRLWPPPFLFLACFHAGRGCLRHPGTARVARAGGI